MLETLTLFRFAPAVSASGAGRSRWTDFIRATSRLHSDRPGRHSLQNHALRLATPPGLPGDPAAPGLRTL